MFDLFPRRNPSLPQDDTGHEQKKRAQQLGSSRSVYQWTDEAPNLKGIPLARKVPFSDQPSLEWLLLAADAGVAIVENLLAVKLQNENAVDVESHGMKNLNEIKEKLKDIQEAYNPPDEDDSLLDKITDAAKHLLSLHESHVMELLNQLQTLVADYSTDEPVEDSVSSLEPYNNLFKTIPLPEIASSFAEDKTFAWLRVAGPNPMLIKGISRLPEKFPLADTDYQKVMGAEDSLNIALEENRLYLLDYEALLPLVENPGETNGIPKQVYAPVVLFAVPVNGDELVPVAIQCGQDPSTYPIFLKPDEPGQKSKWGWQIAKTIVQVADGNYHELFVHLARTHLVIEAFAVATHRHLATQHPLNILLLPHFVGTLFINNSAENSLIAPQGPIDQIFGATISATQKTAGLDRLNFDFYENMPPADFKRRQVDKLPVFPYRDDALLVWNAIHDWVGQYVRIYYSNDDSVVGDTELAAWTAAIMSEGKVEGFKPVLSRDQLIDVVTMVIFTASAQHAAVNFPQKTDMIYSPALSGAGWAPAPEQEEDRTESQWLEYLPSTALSLQQLNVLYLLGSVYYRPLGDYRSNSFPYLKWFEDKNITQKGGALDSFQAALEEVENTINERNGARPQPYEFLLPSRIPSSINI